MDDGTVLIDEKMLFCICPSCKISRKKVGRKFTIIKKGKERNNTARFLCRNCNTWFNGRTGDIMKWLDR